MQPPNPSPSPKKYNGHPTRAVHHTALTALSLTFILSLILFVLSAKYAEFVIQAPSFSHISFLPLTLYAALTPLASLVTALTILLLPERRIALPPTILLLTATLLALGWTATTYLWTTCELVLPVHLGALPSFCPARAVHKAPEVLWRSLARTRSVGGWMCVVCWGVVAWAGWRGRMWERGLSEREERAKAWVTPGGTGTRTEAYELEIRHWDHRDGRYERLGD